MTKQPRSYAAHRRAVRPLRPAVIELTFEVAYRRQQRALRRGVAAAP